MEIKTETEIYDANLKNNELMKLKEELRTSKTEKEELSKKINDLELEKAQK